MKTILLTQDKRAIVDDEDYDYLNQWKWYYSHGYAKRSKHIGRNNGKKIVKPIYMHREIIKVSDCNHTDHINGNKLDNRRINLRELTHQQNTQHRVKLNKNNKSGHAGVHFIKNKNKWVAYIKVDYKRKHLGIFTTIKEAVNARKQAEKNYFL